MRMRQKIGLDITRAVLKAVHGKVCSWYQLLGGNRLHCTRQMVSSATCGVGSWKQKIVDARSESQMLTRLTPLTDQYLETG